MRSIITSHKVLQNLVRRVCKELGVSETLSDVISKNFNFTDEVRFHQWVAKNCTQCIHDPSYCEFWNPENLMDLSQDEFVSWRTLSIKRDGYIMCNQLESMNTSRNTDSNS